MKHNKSKAVGIQLSTVDIKKREARYNKDLDNYKGGLIAGERFKKDGINRLAKDLEEAGTIEIDKISARITSDLKDMIDKGFLTKPYLVTCLDEKYKRHYTRTQTDTTEEKSKKSKIGESQTQIQEDDSEESNMPPNAQQATEPTRTSPQSVKDEQDHDELIENIYGYARGLVTFLTGYSEDKMLKLDDNLALTSQTRKYRTDLAMRLAPHDLKTVYADSRRLAIVLNDFLKQLENESESRRKKEALTSE